MQRSIAVTHRPLVSFSGEVHPTPDMAVDITGMFRRRWPAMIALALALPLLATVVTLLTPRYEDVTARVLFNTSPAEDAVETRSVTAGILDRSIENAIEVSGGDAVRLSVASALGIDVSALPDIQVGTERGSDVVLFTLSETGDGAAAMTANAWADAFLDISRIESLEQIDLAVAGLETRRAEADADGRVTRSAALEARIVELETERELIAAGTDRIVTLAEARHQTPAPLTRNLLFAGTAGLFLAAAAGLALESRDDTIRSPGDLATHGIPLLGSIAHLDHLSPAQLATATLTAPGSVVADAHHRLRAAIVGRENSPRLIAVVSGAEGEGRTTTAANLAAAFAGSGEKTVLVDADLRSPGLAELVGLGTKPGLVDWVRGEATARNVAHRFGQRGVEFALIPAGHATPNGAGIISSKSFANVIAELREDADRVVFDTSALSDAADATGLCAHVDAVVIIARAGRTTVSSLLAEIDVIQRSGGNVAGVALIGEPASPSLL